MNFKNSSNKPPIKLFAEGKMKQLISTTSYSPTLNWLNSCHHNHFDGQQLHHALAPRGYISAISLFDSHIRFSLFHSKIFF